MQGENAASGSGKTICLVDDESDITSIIRRGMEQDGFTVHEFNDPINAW
jgi:DNA-binding response OmpR family regulator